jgi:TRAP-type C4-dicarboxylate transport system permease small subunit
MINGKFLIIAVIIMIVISVIHFALLFKHNKNKISEKDAFLAVWTGFLGAGIATGIAYIVYGIRMVDKYICWSSIMDKSHCADDLQSISGEMIVAVVCFGLIVAFISIKELITRFSAQSTT